MNKLKYIIMLILQCTIFGFSYILVKMLLMLNCPVFLLMGIRFLIGMITLYAAGIVLKLARRRTAIFHSFIKKEIVYGGIAGTVLFSGFALQTYGAYYTTPAKNGLFTGLFVIFVPLIIMFIYKKWSAKPLLLALFCFIGVIIVSDLTFNNISINKGDLLTIACGFAFAIHFVLLERFASDQNIDAINFTTVQLFTVSLLSVILSVIFEHRSYAQINWTQPFLWIIFLGVIATSLTYYVQTVVQAKLSANTVSVISCSETVFAIAISLLMGYEIFSWNLLIGAVVIIIAMIAASLRKA